MDITFSLILPVYNVKDYLNRCVDSILKQDFDKYEVILVDDGSTDGSSLLCDEIAKLHANISVLHKENGGLSSARNAGAKVAKGQYVFWVDSDDWIENRALTILAKAIENESPDIVKFNYFDVSTTKKEEKISSIKCGEYCGKEIKLQIIEDALAHTENVCLSAWSHIYRRDFLLGNKLEYVSERIVGSEDYAFNIEAYLRAESLLVIQDCLYCYDMREGSLSRVYRKNLDIKYDELHDCFLNSIKKCCLYDEIVQSYYSSYIWKTLYVVIGNECYVRDDHSIKEGKRNIKRILRKDRLKTAIHNYDSSKLPWKRRLLLFFMKCKWEGPIVLWLRRMDGRR